MEVKALFEAFGIGIRYVLIKTMIIFCCFLSYTVVYLSLSLHTIIHYLAGSRQDTKTQRKKTTKHRTSVFHDF